MPAASASLALGFVYPFWASPEPNDPSCSLNLSQPYPKRGLGASFQNGPCSCCRFWAVLGPQKSFKNHSVAEVVRFKGAWCCDWRCCRLLCWRCVCVAFCVRCLLPCWSVLMAGGRLLFLALLGLLLVGCCFLRLLSCLLPWTDLRDCAQERATQAKPTTPRTPS